MVSRAIFFREKMTWKYVEMIIGIKEYQDIKTKIFKVAD